MRYHIITNNPSVPAVLGSAYAVTYVERPLRDVFVLVRDMIHSGHKLYTHPLSGSVKPYETPFKSIIVSDKTGELDLDSLWIIENSIITCDKFKASYPDVSDRHRKDFELIDLTLLQGALSSISASPAAAPERKSKKPR